jgi:hypothetical protein
MSKHCPLVYSFYCQFVIHAVLLSDSIQIWHVCIWWKNKISVLGGAEAKKWHLGTLVSVTWCELKCSEVQDIYSYLKYFWTWKPLSIADLDKLELIMHKFYTNVMCVNTKEGGFFFFFKDFKMRKSPLGSSG